MHVSKQITLLGLNVTNSNEQLQTKWDAEMKEMFYLLVIAAFGLACAALMLNVTGSSRWSEKKELLNFSNGIEYERSGYVPVVYASCAHRINIWSFNRYHYQFYRCRRSCRPN
jgi:hypothetical protein